MTLAVPVHRLLHHFRRVHDERCRDSAIERIVTDPMVRAIMRADRVEPEEFATLLRTVASSLECRADKPCSSRRPFGC